MAGGVKIFSKVCKNQDLFDYEKKNAKTRICVATVMGSTTLEALGSGFYSFFFCRCGPGDSGDGFK